MGGVIFSFLDPLEKSTMSSRQPRILILLILTLACLPLHAAEVCENPTIDNDIKPWGIVQTKEMTVKQVAVTELEGITHAIEAQIDTPDPKASYRCGLYQTVNAFIPKDAAIKLTFKAKGTPNKQLRFNIQTNGHPWDNTLSTSDFKVTSDWKTYTFNGKAKRDYSPGGLRIYLVFGQDAGTVSVTDIHLDVDNAGLPPVGKPINANNDFKQKTTGWGYNGKLIDVQILKEDNKDFAQLTLKNVDPKKPWEHSFSQRIASPLPKDAKVKMVAIMRSPTADAKVDLYFQGKDGYKERLMLAPGIKLTDTWQTVELNGTMPKDYDANDCGIMMLMGYQDQVIDIQSITVTFVE
jgi:hypothetical protein